MYSLVETNQTKNLYVAGLVVSSFCYLQFFPAPHSADGIIPDSLSLFFRVIRYLLLLVITNQSLCLLIHVGWGPHAYFQVLSESASNSQPSASVVVRTNSLSTLPPESTTSYISTTNHQSEDRILLQHDIEIANKH